ncbi:hypothetical protein AB1Y20_013003 [Prymnesium parvum]|uniref:Glycoside hydrolase family 5 domain-containing protein n=1 Tax=Prymnesium parvum TaxID=97485 RepID=A0AB34ILH3_PRYPA
MLLALLAAALEQPGAPCESTHAGDFHAQSCQGWCHAKLINHAGQPVVLQGVNMYLEWYRNAYAAVRSGSSALDIPHLRRAVPAANTIRFVGLLWKDSIKSSDGLECSTDDPSTGYFDEECMRFIDSLITQATEAGLWVILTARAKYAAGWDPPEAQNDVWSDPKLKHMYYEMWRHVARRFRWTDRIAGYEIMSEPRTKTESQASVRDFIRGACEVVHSEDPGALCVVGPRPYYKLWELTEDVLQPTGSNTLYTFDFFVPKTFVMSDTDKESKRDCAQGENCEGAMFPALYPCREVYETWWHGKPGCQDGDSMVDVNARWIKEILQKYAFDFGRKHGVPVYCNQWGVKDEVLEANGRLRYAEAVLDAFTDLGIASTYWIWRSYTKGGRDVHEPVWGFELAHNDGPHEALDGAMLTTLQAGFLRTGRKYPASLDPCGAQLASVNASFAVTPLNASILAKRISLAQPTSLRFAPTPLPHSGVQDAYPKRLHAYLVWITRTVQ